MLTLFRLTWAWFLSVGLAACFMALGCSDTAQGQTLTVSNASLSFTAAQGSNPSPPTQQVSVGSTGAAISYLISTDQKWLLASTGAFGGSGGTSGIDPITVQINSLSLTAGTFTGIVTLSPTNGSAVATIKVTLTITGSGPATSTLTASLTQLNFAFETGKPGPPSQGVQITSTGINLPITSVSTNPAPTNNCPPTWLQASPSASTTPATITVSIVTTGLTTGACTGAITVSSTSAGNGTTSVTIGVTLFISSSALLNVVIPPGLTSVTLSQGARPVQFAIPLTSSDPTVPVAFTAGAGPGADNNWLAVSPVTGSTPASLNVQVTPGSALAVGNYTGSIIITSYGLFNGSTTIPIAFNLTSGSAVSVSPSGSLNFNEAQGGAVPPSQTLTLTGTANTNFTTSVTQQSGGLWLQASPTSGSITGGTPGTVTLTVLPTNPPLGQGTYSSLVTISFQSNGLQPILIPVSLNVGPPASALVVSPSSLTFNYLIGGTVPAAQTISVTNPASGSLAYTVGSITQSWLNVGPAGGNTPGTVFVSVVPQGLLPGTYTGSFLLTASGAAPIATTVTMNITQTTTPQIFIVGNAASGVGGQLAPGEIITIKGSQLGPATPVQFTVGSLTQPTLGGVGVTFSGFPGTLLYVSASQINVTVPYEVAGMSSTLVVVNYNGGSSSGVTQPVGAASLGIFTANSTGSGQASILNQNYSVNSPSNPASQASYISVYATGGGQTIPASTDGEVSPTASLLPLVLQSAVTATIAGRNAPVVFAGAAPGFVTGLVQFNIQIPPGTNGPALPIVISINGAAVVLSQSGATVSVQ